MNEQHRDIENTHFFLKGYIDCCIEVISQTYTTAHSKLVPFASAKINNKNSDASDRLGLSEKT